MFALEYFQILDVNTFGLDLNKLLVKTALFCTWLIFFL